MRLPHRPADPYDSLGLCQGDHANALTSAEAGVLAAQRFLSYDAVTASNIPSSATAASYYADHPTVSNLGAVRQQCPHARLMPILVFATHPAPGTLKEYVGWENGIECDCEPTDLTPAQVGPWAKRVKSMGGAPRIYTSLSEVGAVVASCHANGLQRSDVKLRTAHWNGVPHVCSGIAGTAWGTINADSTQFTDHYLGRSLDASLCEPDWFASPAKPPVHQGPAGVEHFTGTFDYKTGRWTVNRLRQAGSLTYTLHPKDAVAELHVQMSNGDMSIKAK